MQTFLSLPLASILRHRRRSGCFAAVAVCFATLALAETAGAATWTVTSLSDSGPGSLRDAIAVASPGDTIRVQAAGTITLTGGELYIGEDLTIVGPGASQLAISGNHTTRVFEIASGATVSVSGFTVENGMSPANFGGAGIFNAGTLNVANCTISGNNTVPGTSGGGILSVAPLTIAGSTISGNSATIGGGIWADNALTMTDSIVDGNSAVQGGGIYNGWSLTMTASTVSNNSASDDGGGLYEQNLLGSAITNSTFSGNVASVFGGAIWILGGPIPLAIQNSTIANNTAQTGGGYFNGNPFPGFTFTGTLFANNGGGNCFGEPLGMSLGYNVADDNTCQFASTGDQNGVTPGAGLDPKGLHNNGGPTPTIALLPSSPAVDLIPAASCSLTTDQRGTARPQGKGCDAGAYELVPTVPFSSFSGHLAVANGKLRGFVLSSQFTLASGAPALQLKTQTLTLQIANYTLTLPPGSLHPLWNAPNAPLAYDGTVNGVNLVIGLISLGGDNWIFDAAGAPVTINATNPVPVTLTIGQNTGSTTVQEIIR